MSFGFSQTDCQRIARAVKQSEQQSTPVTPRSAVPGGAAQPQWIVGGVLAGSLTQGGSQTLNMDGGVTVVVYDALLQSGQALASGTKVVGTYDAYSGKYYATSWTTSKWPIIRGTLTSSLSQGSSATMDEAVTSQEFTVNDWMLGSGESISSGLKIIAMLDLNDGNYYVVAAECEAS